MSIFILHYSPNSAFSIAVCRIVHPVHCYEYRESIFDIDIYLFVLVIGTRQRTEISRQSSTIHVRRLFNSFDTWLILYFKCMKRVHSKGSFHHCVRYLLTHHGGNCATERISETFYTTVNSP